MIAEYLPYGMQKALDLIPMVGSSTDIFRTNTFRIWGKLIWSPYLLITIPVLIGILCMPFAIKRIKQYRETKPSQLLDPQPNYQEALTSLLPTHNEMVFLPFSLSDVKTLFQLLPDGMEEELEKTDWQIVNSWLGTLYPELRDTSN